MLLRGVPWSRCNAITLPPDCLIVECHVALVVDFVISLLFLFVDHLHTQVDSTRRMHFILMIHMISVENFKGLFRCRKLENDWKKGVSEKKGTFPL